MISVGKVQKKSGTQENFSPNGANRVTRWGGVGVLGLRYWLIFLESILCMSAITGAVR